jgi:hypothetical protein
MINGQIESFYYLLIIFFLFTGIRRFILAMKKSFLKIKIFILRG